MTTTIVHGIDENGNNIVREYDSENVIINNMKVITEIENIRSIKNLIIGGMVKEIEVMVQGESLENVIIDDSVAEIHPRFVKSAPVKNAIINARIKELDHMFECCEHLEYIVLPITIKHITELNFTNVYGLTIVYPGTINAWKRIKKDKEWYKNSTIKVVCADGIISYDNNSNEK